RNRKYTSTPPLPFPVLLLTHSLTNAPYLSDLPPPSPLPPTTPHSVSPLLLRQPSAGSPSGLGRRTARGGEVRGGALPGMGRGEGGEGRGEGGERVEQTDWKRE